jgi:hypothetical protein
MPNASLTLAVLGGLDPDLEGVTLSDEDRQKLTATLRDRARAFNRLSGFDLGEQLVGNLASALRTPVASVLEEVWKQRRELRDATRRGDTERDVSGEVGLVQHSISTTIHPAVEIQWNGQTLATIAVDVKAALELDAVQVVIHNASIVGVTAGTLESTISYEYDGIPLLPPYKRTVHLPGRLDFPGG